jgi:hypothetical protein
MEMYLDELARLRAGAPARPLPPPSHRRSGIDESVPRGDRDQDDDEEERPQ